MKLVTKSTLSSVEQATLARAKIDVLGKLYAGRRRKMIDYLMSARGLSYAKQTRIKAIIVQVNREIAFLDKRVKKLGREAIVPAYEMGFDIAAEPIIRAGLTEHAVMSAQVHTQAVAAVAEQITADLLAANGIIKQNCVRYLRATQQKLVKDSLLSKVIGEGLITGASRRTVSDKIEGLLWEKMRNGKLLTIKNKTYDPEYYAKMVAITRTREATTTGTVNTCLQYAVDLVQISSHSTSCEMCEKFEGRIYSISGTSSKYPMLNEAPPYHPHCKHVVLPQPALQIEEEGRKR